MSKKKQFFLIIAVFFTNFLAQTTEMEFAEELNSNIDTNYSTFLEPEQTLDIKQMIKNLITLQTLEQEKQLRDSVDQNASQPVPTQQLSCGLTGRQYNGEYYWSYSLLNIINQMIDMTIKNFADIFIGSELEAPGTFKNNLNENAITLENYINQTDKVLIAGNNMYSVPNERAINHLMKVIYYTKLIKFLQECIDEKIQQDQRDKEVE